MDKTHPEAEGSSGLLPPWTAPAYLLTSAVVAIVFMGLDLGYGPYRGEAAIKALPAIFLALYAAVRFHPALVTALLFSAIGDFFLALNLQFFELGLLFFALAHVIYLAIFTYRLVRFGWRRERLPVVALFAAFAGLIAWRLAPGLGDLAGAVSAYMILITLMASAAALAPGSRLILFGAAFFLASDALLGFRLFQGAFMFEGGPDLGGVVVWIVYYLAQLCLAVGIAERPPEGPGEGSPDDGGGRDDKVTGDKHPGGETSPDKTQGDKAPDKAIYAAKPNGSAPQDDAGKSDGDKSPQGKSDGGKAP